MYHLSQWNGCALLARLLDQPWISLDTMGIIDIDTYFFGILLDFFFEVNHAHKENNIKTMNSFTQIPPQLQAK